MILGFDVSNHQGTVDMAAARAGGRDFVVIKATQGVTFADPFLAANRAKAHAAGMVVGLYQFADVDDPAADAHWFLSHVGPLQPGEFLVLDEEVPRPNKVAWCQAWMQAVHDATGTWPLLYTNGSTVASYNWAPIAANCGLWLARYDKSTVQPALTGAWSAPVMKQYSDAGSVLGVAAPCDVDVFYGSREQLAAYGSPGSTDMPLNQQDYDAIAAAVWQSQGDPSQGKGIWEGDRLIGIDAKADAISTVAQQARDAATGANTRAGEIETILNTQVLPKLGQAAPVIDEAKLAAALLADPASVDALGKAIAAHLKLASS